MVWQGIDLEIDAEEAACGRGHEGQATAGRDADRSSTFSWSHSPSGRMTTYGSLSMVIASLRATSWRSHST